MPGCGAVAAGLHGAVGTWRRSSSGAAGLAASRPLTGAPGTSCTSTRARGVQPWRFNLGDYSAAFIDAPHTQRDLAGDPVAASWDAALAPAMQRHGLAIAEEALAASLLADLQP